MKIDFIEKYNPDYPDNAIVRIYEFDYTEAKNLQNIFSELSKGKIKEIEFESLPFVISADGSSLILKCTPQDKGITQPSPKNFICKLSKEGWRKAKHLTEPFCKPGLLNGFQWLYDIDTDIELLFSIDGSW